ncbi:MAG TPA: hypothetical protein DEG96_08280 [Candidatus Atribacteria bacterium]|nr:hypothetical protein [Candidatus Atribacteria bacterium]
MANLAVSIENLNFKNPIFVSAGDPTLTAKLAIKSIETGVGAVVLKTCSKHEEEYIVTRATRGFPDKFVEKGNFMNLSPGIAFKTPQEEAAMIKDIMPIAKKENCVVIASIGAPARAWDEWEEMAKLMEEAGADAIEIMMCCPVPMVPGLGAEGATEENLRDILKVIKKAVKIPLIMKTSETHSFFLRQFARGIKDGGGDAWHVQAHVNTPVVDIDTGELMCPDVAGWGRPQRGIGVETALVTSTLVEIPILSTGGVYDWRSVVERLMAGATLVGIHSEITYKGFEILHKAIKGLEDFLDQKGYKGVQDIIGKAVPCIDPEWKKKWFVTHAVPKEKVYIAVDEKKCTGCGLCFNCIFDGIYLDKVTNKAKLDLEKCERCGRCVSLCPKDAIIMQLK